MEKQDSYLSRRNFMGNFLVGAGAMGLGFPRFPKLDLPPPLNKSLRAPKKVLILGAGLAGLAAAWELREAGHEVTVLEARMRPGGKVFTLRQPFAGNLHAEAGAIGFSDSYTVTNKYISALGITKVYLSFPNLSTVYYMKGKRLVVGPGQNPQWPYNLTKEENDLGPMGIVNKYFIETLPEDRSNPEAWNAAPLSNLDKISFGDYMRTQGASKGAVDLIRDTMWFGVLPEKTSMLASAISDFGLFMGGAPFMLEGGNDRLPMGMAELLSSQIKYGVIVSAVAERDNRVEVMVSRRGQTEKYTADRVVCTIPATVLRNIEFSPRLTSPKQEAINKIPFLDVTRSFVQLDRAYWQDEGNGGTSFTDQSMTIYRHPVYKDMGKNDRCILEAYMYGPDAKDMGKRKTNEILNHNLEIMDKVHPGIHQHFEGGHVKAWSQDPFALGGPSWAGPGHIKLYLDALQHSHGRVHFAGEYTTILRSTMEGALRSGTRAAREVHEASS